MVFPIDEQHKRKGGVDDVVITTQREVLVIIIIGRTELKCYIDTKLTTINHKRLPSGIERK